MLHLRFLLGSEYASELLLGSSLKLLHTFLLKNLLTFANLQQKFPAKRKLIKSMLKLLVTSMFQLIPFPDRK